MKIYIISRIEDDVVYTLAAFRSFDKALNYLNYLNDTHKDHCYEFVIDSTVLEK